MLAARPPGSLACRRPLSKKTTATRRRSKRRGSTTRAEPLALPEFSRANADDRLPLASRGQVEGGDGIVEG